MPELTTRLVPRVKLSWDKVLGGTEDSSVNRGKEVKFLIRFGLGNICFWDLAHLKHVCVRCVSVSLVL